MNLPPRPRAPLYQRTYNTAVVCGDSTEQPLARFSFKSGPFYDVEEALAPTVELQGEASDLEISWIIMA